MVLWNRERDLTVKVIQFDSLIKPFSHAQRVADDPRVGGCMRY
jgi:hypothetical protein